MIPLASNKAFDRRALASLNIEGKHRIHNRRSAINMERLPGDKAGLVHAQQHHGVANIRWRAYASQRCPAALVPALNGLEHLRRQATHHTILRSSGADHIHCDGFGALEELGKL